MITTEALSQTAVYLGAAIIVVPIVKKIKLSAVLGYLIAGVIIGPFILGLTGDSQEKQEAVLHFAEFGVVMMLFLIGLELRPALLWRLRGAILGIGGSQVILTTIAIAIIAHLFGLSINASIATGMILSLSSTAIVLQILNEKSLLRTPAGQNVFSVLLFQDIAVIPILAIMPLLESSKLTTLTSEAWITGYSGWIKMIIVFVTVGSVILLGRFGINPLFRFIAATRIREIFTALALFIVIGISWLMQEIGLSPALGAFVAGVVLAESEYRHQLELDIEPFKGLLLGLFFMMVGASVDFALFYENTLLIISLVSLLIFIKWLILLAIGKIFRMNLAKKAIFAFSLAQAGEFAFVLFGMAIQLNVLDVRTVKLLTVVVALSMATTPILMMILDKWILPKVLEQPGKKESDTIDDNSNPIIIAGYGRFGQTIGRLLRANGIASTILEFNSDHVETIRRFGQKVYYGDATRIDLLEAAGAKTAKAIVIAIAEEEKSISLIKEIKQHFPHLKIFVRAIGRPHAYELMAFNDVDFERETLLSALNLGEKILSTAMGFHPYRAKRAAQIFLEHDKKILTQQYAIYKENSNEYVESSKKNELTIAEILKADMAGEAQNDYGWSAVLSEKDAKITTDDKNSDGI